MYADASRPPQRGLERRARSTAPASPAPLRGLALVLGVAYLLTLADVPAVDPQRLHTNLASRVPSGVEWELALGRESQGAPLHWSELLFGLVWLHQRGELALEPGQAAALRAEVHGRLADLKKSEARAEAVLGSVLTPGQREFLLARGLPEGSPAQGASFLAMVEQRAAGGPPGGPPEPAPPGMAMPLPSLVAGLAAAEGEPTVRLTPAQASTILPALRAWVEAEARCADASVELCRLVDEETLDLLVRHRQEFSHGVVVDGKQVPVLEAVDAVLGSSPPR